jgi:hypothetical protein
MPPFAFGSPDDTRSDRTARASARDRGAFRGRPQVRERTARFGGLSVAAQSTNAGAVSR